MVASHTHTPAAPLAAETLESHTISGRAALWPPTLQEGKDLNFDFASKTQHYNYLPSSLLTVLAAFGPVLIRVLA